MKKILISYIPNTLNYGSAMLAINLIAGLRNRLGHRIEIYCDCDEYNLLRLKEGTGDNSLKSFVISSNNHNFYQKVWRLLRRRLPLVCEVVNRFDMMIVLGGDNLSETYMRSAIIQGLQYRQITRSCRVILAGQSLGPFNGVYGLLARWVFKNLTIITRDDNSYEFCKNKIHLNDVVQGCDLALHSLPFQFKWNAIRQTYGLEEDKYIVIVPSGLFFEYTPDKEAYVVTWHEITSRILQRYKNRKVVFLAHVLSPELASDVPMIEELMISLSSTDKERVVVCKNPMQPAEARAILGGARFVVTGRMHAAVSTFFEGKPALSLSYSEKYKGVIGRGLGLPSMIIDCRNRRWGQASKILNEFDLALDNIENEYANLTLKIQKNISECHNLVEHQLDFITEQVNML